MVDVLYKGERLSKSRDYLYFHLQSNLYITALYITALYITALHITALYITALYIAITPYITVTGQLPKIFSCLIFCKVDLYIAVTLYKTVILPFLKGDFCTLV